MKRVVGGVLLSLSMGCQTVDQARDAQVHRQNERAYFQEAVVRLQGRLENIELQQEVLRTQLEVLQGGLGRAEEERAALRSAADQERADHREVMTRVEAWLQSEPAKSEEDAPRGRGYEHRVESGHTLSAIAVAYDTSVEVIKQANGLSSDQIYVGQTLFIPE